ncbi:MAG: hypothetical protein ABSF62_24575 [Bryobacteraceae bacterium]|jgi:hypothetical protein
MEKKRSTRIKITERALFQRVNRKLNQDGEKLCTARSDSARQQLGRFYVVETGQQPKRAASSGVAHVNVDLEKLARKLGVIQPWEELES